MHGVQRDVESFHRALDVPVGGRPALRRPELRAELIREEAAETIQAIRDGDLVDAIDGLCDLLCVIYGAAAEWGVDLEPFWDEVHRTNMAKQGGPVREDGKRLKPPGWEPPRIAELLAEHRGRWMMGPRVERCLKESCGRKLFTPPGRTPRCAFHGYLDEPRRPGYPMTVAELAAQLVRRYGLLSWMTSAPSGGWHLPPQTFPSRILSEEERRRMLDPIENARAAARLYMRSRADNDERQRTGEQDD